MNVLVTGATGFVGREIVARLHGFGHNIHAIVRDPGGSRATSLATRFQVTVHGGDVLDAVSLAGALQGMDEVIHLVGIISEIGDNTFENVHISGTRNILSAAAKAKVQRIVQMSALGTRPNATSRYHRSKWAAEELVRRSGLEFTIFRPSLIYGAQDGFVNLFGQIIRSSPVVPVLGRRDVKFQPVAVEAVADAFVKALTEPKSVGETYDLCGPETFTLDDLIQEILSMMRRRRLKIRVPSVISKAQAAVLEVVFPKLLGRPPPLNRDQILMLQEDNVGQAGPANALFGLHHPRFREGIGKYLA